MRFIFKRIKNPFYINGLALSLALKQRLGTTPKCPINLSQSLASVWSKKTCTHLFFICMFFWVRNFPLNTFWVSLTKNNRYIFFLSPILDLFYCQNWQMYVLILYCQQAVPFRTTFTLTIILNLWMKWLLGSDLSEFLIPQLETGDTWDSFNNNSFQIVSNSQSQFLIVFVYWK